MTTDQAVARAAEHENLTKDLIEALEGVIGWVPSRQHWHTDAAEKAVDRARAVLSRAKTAE